jgi:hypothetical protein
VPASSGQNKWRFHILIGAFVVQSCCAYHTVTIKNNSGDDRLVTLRNHSYRYYKPEDYFWLTDLSSRRFRNKTGQKLAHVDVDSMAGIYSFILPRNTKLVVQHCLGYPDIRQQVIVYHNDTIRLMHDPRTKIRRRRIDNFFGISVNIQHLPVGTQPLATVARPSK